jgi:hypothetical protein
VQGVVVFVPSCGLVEFRDSYHQAFVHENHSFITSWLYLLLFGNIGTRDSILILTSFFFHNMLFTKNFFKLCLEKCGKRGTKFK